MKSIINIDFNGLYNQKFEKKYNQELIKTTMESYFANNQHSLFANIDQASVDNILDCAEYIKQNFENLIVVGIGGSSLATQGILNSIKTKGLNVIVLDNVDPTLVADTLASVDLKKTAFNFVSKSGNTVEVLSVLQIVIDKRKTKAAVKRQVVVTTTESDNPLFSSIIIISTYKSSLTLNVAPSYSPLCQ